MLFTEADDLIDIRYDNVFKAVFTKNIPESQKALSGLVSSLIKRKVSIETITANEPPIENLWDRQIRFDINCKAHSGELINVEMCLNPYPYEPVRLEFYSAKLFIGQDIKGTDKNFDNLKESYQIAILAKKRFFSDDEVFHTFKFYDAENKISLNGKSQIITIELSKLDKIIEKPVKDMSSAEHWAIFFQYLTDKAKREKINQIIECQEGITMASEVVSTFTKEEIEYYHNESKWKYELDMQSMRAYERKQAKQEMRHEIKQELKQEMKQEMRQEMKQEFIDLLKSGKSPEDIIKEYENS